ncbi:hypothetical protein Nmel_000490 [Mimus melanotis]
MPLKTELFHFLHAFLQMHIIALASHLGCCLTHHLSQMPFSVTLKKLPGFQTLNRALCPVFPEDSALLFIPEIYKPVGHCGSGYIYHHSSKVVEMGYFSLSSQGTEILFLWCCHPM